MRFARKWIALLLALAMLFTMTGFAEEAVQLEPVAEEAEEVIEEKPAEAPVEEPAEEPAEEPVEEPAEEPAEVPAEEPVEEPAEVPVEEPAEVPVEESVEEPAEEPTEVPVEEPVEESTAVPEPAEADAIIQSFETPDIMENLKDAQPPMMTFNDDVNTDGMVPITKNHKHSWELIKQGEISATYAKLYGNDQYYLHKVTLQQPRKYECTSCHAIRDAIALMRFEESHSVSGSRCVECGQSPAYSYSLKHTQHNWSILLPTSMMEEAGFVDETEYASKGEIGHACVKMEFLGFSCSGCDGISVAANVYTELRIHEFVTSGNVRRCRDCGYSESLPEKITLSAKKLTLGVNETAKLSIKDILPQGAQGEVTFKTSNTKIVLVGKENSWASSVTVNLKDAPSVLLQAKAKGTATITAKTSNGKKAKCTVTVKKAPRSTALNASALEMGVGESADLQITFTPASSFGNVEWLSDDEAVVSVNNGKIMALSEGSATITAKVYNQPEMRCEVTVKSAPTAENAKLTPEAASVRVKKKLQLGVTYEGAAGAVMKWKSSNTKVATVSKKGVVKGVKKGKVTITATLYNGIKITTVVTVTK